MKANCIYLGVSTGKSKKGDPLYFCGLGIPYNDFIKGDGYMASTLFVEESEYNKLKTLKAGEKHEFDLKYIGKGNYTIISM